MIIPPGVSKHPEYHPLANGWINYKSDNDDEADHVIPCNDQYEHTLSPDCWCGPIDDLSCNDYKLMHNAADDREAFELGSRLPS